VGCGHALVRSKLCASQLRVALADDWIVEAGVECTIVGDDSSDCRERVFDAVVEFGIQDFAGLFDTLALGNVDVHADQAFCVTGWSYSMKLHETARLDPADRFAGTHNAKLCVMLAAPLGE
jgi:hypothetical protein